MRNTSMKKSKVTMMCVLALVVIAAGLYVYRWSTAKPKCNCMFPNSKRYGVIGQGGGCRVVDCEIHKQPGKPTPPCQRSRLTTGFQEDGLKLMSHHLGMLGRIGGILSFALMSGLHVYGQRPVTESRNASPLRQNAINLLDSTIDELKHSRRCRGARDICHRHREVVRRRKARAVSSNAGFYF